MGRWSPEISLPAEYSPHLGLCSLTSGVQDPCLLSPPLSSCQALPWPHFQSGLPSSLGLSRGQGTPQVPADSFQSWSCTRALEPSGPSAIWSHLCPSATEARLLLASRPAPPARDIPLTSQENQSRCVGVLCQHGLFLVPSGTSVPSPSSTISTPQTLPSQTSPLRPLSALTELAALSLPFPPLKAQPT